MTFTFTQADVEKLIEQYLSTINLKTVGKYIPDYRENTVSVDVEKISGAKPPDFKELFRSLPKIKPLGRLQFELCDQCKSERSGQPQKGICTCQNNPNSWIR